ncbi:MAG: GGDEF domain-containing protein [Firmicutes bacterium]|jgi:two-component system cell cycle response regulator|nr:GGDEF domain-containing protein [Bacillota bacterium]
MDSIRPTGISLFGEFTDKSVEDEFLADSLRGSARMTAYLALVFGAIVGLFAVHSYFAEGSLPVFMRTTPIRLTFIAASVVVFLVSRRIGKHSQLLFTTTIYQVLLAVMYLLTLNCYDSLNYFSVFGLFVVTLGIFLLPNRIVISQTISLLLSILFFVYPIHKMAGLQPAQFNRIVAYQVIILSYCNVSHYWDEAAKRKVFLAKRELAELSCRDPLTGIYNRKKFDDALAEWMRLSNQSGSPLSIILFDIDNFKHVNDTQGHILGDNVLRDAAAAVKQLMRDTDVFARWGGDEFAILLPYTDIHEARAVADRIRAAVATNVSTLTPTEITCSFGIAAYQNGDTKQSLLRKADDLLLKAKASGKDKVVS